MTFSAIGRAVQKDQDGTLHVRVEIQDGDGKMIRFESYEAKSLAEIQALAKKDLDALIAREADATLSAAVVGQLLASTQPAEVPADAAAPTDAPTTEEP